MTTDTKTIEAFDPIKSKIIELKDEFSEVPDCTTDEGFKQAGKDYRFIRSFEINLDNARKQLNQDDQDRIKMRNDQAKLIDHELKQISGPFKEAIDARKEADAQKERDRIAALEQRLNDIRGFVSEALGKDSQAISDIIEAVDLIEVDETFQEFQSQARQALETTKEQLAQALQNALAREENERLRKENEALQKQTAEAMEKAQDQEIDLGPGGEGPKGYNTDRVNNNVTTISPATDNNSGNAKGHDEAEADADIWRKFEEHMMITGQDSKPYDVRDYNNFKAGWIYCKDFYNQE